MSPRVLSLIALAACGVPDGDGPLHVERATPDYAHLVGGTTIVLTGSGFAAAPNRVLVAGREAPIARAIDDTTLEVVVPPGEEPGDAEVVVLSGDTNVRATGILRYSAPPMITAVDPADVVFSSTSTRVTLTGSGFRDEGAGIPNVVIDGLLATDLQITSDTQLTFTAPPGPALVRPDIQLINDRGAATRQRAFRYRPSERDGLLLFSANGDEFAVFFDPSDNSTVSIPWIGSPTARFTAVARDDQGDYWGFDRSRRFGRIDMRAQQVTGGIQPASWFPTILRTESEYLGLERTTRRFGRFDPTTGSFTPIGTTSIPCCGSYGLASDGTTLYFTARGGGTLTITPIDRTTGIPGTPVPLIAPPGYAIEEMRFFHGTLYAASRDSTLSTIDPITGIVTVLPVASGRGNAMEIFE